MTDDKYDWLYPFKSSKKLRVRINYIKEFYNGCKVALSTKRSQCLENISTLKLFASVC